MTKPLSEDFAEYFMPDGDINLDLEIAIYKGIKALESSITEKDEQILAMRNCSNCQHYTSDKCSVCRFVSSTFTGDFIDNWKMKTKG